MKRINLNGITNSMSDSEMKQVKGGDPYEPMASDLTNGDDAIQAKPCDGKKQYDACQYKGQTGVC